MRRFLGFIYERIDYISLLLAVIFSIYLLSYNESPEIRIIQGKVNTVFSVLYTPVMWVKGIKEVRAENELLREKAMQLALLNTSLLNYQYENEELRKMLDYERESKFELIPSKVISRGISPLISSAVIDVGTNQGLRTNFAVLNINGIVGKTISVGEKAAVVQLMTDYNFRISVKLEESGATGILRWKEGDTFEVWGILKTIEVRIGERILTSGYSDIFPPSLPVGEVVDIVDRQEMLHKIIIARAYTDFSALQHVFVVKRE